MGGSVERAATCLQSPKHPRRQQHCLAGSGGPSWLGFAPGRGWTETPSVAPVRRQVPLAACNLSDVSSNQLRRRRDTTEVAPYWTVLGCCRLQRANRRMIGERRPRSEA